MTLDIASKYSEVGAFVCAILGLSIWAWIKTGTKTYIKVFINKFRREYWIWSHFGIFLKYMRNGRERWNKCHTPEGTLLLNKATMGDLSRFDKFGLHYGDGLSPLDHEKIEELKKLGL